MKKNERIKEAVKLMTENCNNKYFDLVWYARANKPKLLAAEQYEDVYKMNEIEKKYPNEISDLGSDDNWSHGFNSGMLAASRLYLGMIEESVEDAILEFPCLDS